MTQTASDAKASPRSLLRTRGQHDSGRVGMIELFFDLVFVFAVTQLSHSLLAHLSVAGAAHVAILLPAIWWVWMYTSWSTNWLNPERLPVRSCLFVLMGAGLVLAAAIPEAFEARGDVFAFAYVSMQVGRTCFVLWAVRHERRGLVRNFQRVIFWLVMSGICWITGGFMEPQMRWYWWLLALGIELTAPFFFFWAPALGRSEYADWDIDGGHMAERCALFVIIALGESLLVTGATFAELHWNIDTVLAMLTALVGTIAMWWVYFDTGAERAAHRITHSADPGRQGRNAYTYLHLLIVAGIIVSAVADEVVLAHPAHATDGAIVAILSGPLLYLLGNLLFKWITNDRRGPPFSHLVGVVLLLILAPLALNHLFSALVLASFTAVVLVVVATWESIALRRA